MDSESRQLAIYDMIKSNKVMSVNALSDRFGVSCMTIRRDLDQLERSHLIERSYGKARIADESKSDLSWELRKSMNLSDKQKIALLAVKYLSENSINSIYVDGSSTAAEFIKVLPSNRSLTIFTNSMTALILLHQKPWVTTFAIGGFLDRDANSFDDMTAVDICKHIYVDATFTSCGGVSTEGTFNNGITGSQIRRTMLKNSHQNYILADHSKFNSHGIFLLNTWDNVDFLITDQEPSVAFLSSVTSQGVSVVWE